MAFHAASKLRRTSARFATSPGYRRDPFASRSRSGTSDALPPVDSRALAGAETEGVMVRNVEVTKESEHDEDSLAKAKTLAGTLCEVLEHAQDALRTDRNEIRYIEAFARTLSDPGVRSTSGAGLILVALAGSPRAPVVLSRAIAVSRAQGARLVLLRSIGLPAEVPQDLWRSTDEPLLDVLDRRARAYLDECEAGVPGEVRGGTQVVIGSPWQSICDTARNLRANLIVIGSHGYSGFDRLLGTTAAKVVNHAPCSVLVVRDVSAEGPPS